MMNQGEDSNSITCQISLSKHKIRCHCRPGWLTLAPLVSMCDIKKLVQQIPYSDICMYHAWQLSSTILGLLLTYTHADYSCLISVKRFAAGAGILALSQPL